MNSNGTKNRKMIAAGIGIAVAAVVIWIAASQSSKTGVVSEETTTAQTEETTAETTQAALQEDLPVSETEAKLLSGLYQALCYNDYVDAAQLLNENEEAFAALTEETLDGKKYCYWEEEQEDGQILRVMEELAEDGEMEGLVLGRYNTAFCGEFSDGQPNGTVCAIQTIILDEPRYTYAEGTWRNGVMNGEGKTGYHYYINAPESGFIRTEKSGTYANNLLNGDFVYMTESGGGEILSWNMKAENGVTVLDDAWVHYPFRKEYMLTSVESEDRAYVLSEDRAQEIMWDNLITWD